MADFKHREFTISDVHDSPTVALISAADVEDVRGLAIKYDESGNGVVAGTKGEAVYGIAIISNGVQKDDCYGYIKKGEDISVQRRGTGSAIAGGAFSAGDELTTDENGKLVKAEAGNFVIATAVEASEGADSVVRVDISKIGYKAAGA